jgi:hypothetical protein
MIRHGVATLTTSAQKLSTALGLASDVPVRKITVQPGSANSGVVYIGGPGVTTSVFGFRLEAPVATIPSAPFVFEDASSPALSLGDFYLVGTSNDTVTVLYVPYL